MFKIIITAILFFSNIYSASTSHGVHLSADDFSLLWLIPFLGILFSIALIPLIKPTFWHHHYGKVSLAWALIFCIPYLIVFRDKGVYDILLIYLFI